MAVSTIQTLAQRQAIIRQRLLENNPNDFSTAPGSVVGNLFISPLAVGDVQQQARTYLVAVGEAILDILATLQDQSLLQLLAQALNTTVSDVQAQLSALLDSWGSNFGESRLQPKKSTGVAVFGRVDAPTQDITIGIGKIVETGGGVRYSTTASATMFASSAGTYFDTKLLLFVIKVPIEAVQNGKNGDVPADSLTKISTPVEGLPFITNTRADQRGPGPRVRRGVRRPTAPEVAGLREAHQGGPRLLPPERRGRRRGRLRGPDRRPSLDAGGRPHRHLVQGRGRVGEHRDLRRLQPPDHPKRGRPVQEARPRADVHLVGLGRPSARPRRRPGRLRAGPRLHPVHDTADVPCPGLLHLRRPRGGRAEPLQRRPVRPGGPAPRRHPANAARTPILAKRAEPLDIDYTVAVMVVPGENPATVRNNVREALDAFAAGWMLNDTAYVSDLNEVVEGVSGVLRISGEPVKFAPTGQSGVRAAGIPTAKNQYPRLLNINIF